MTISNFENLSWVLHGAGYDIMAFAGGMAALDEGVARIELLVTRVSFPEWMPHGVALASMARVKKREVRRARGEPGAYRRNRRISGRAGDPSSWQGSSACSLHRRIGKMAPLAELSPIASAPWNRNGRIDLAHRSGERFGLYQRAEIANHDSHTRGADHDLPAEVRDVHPGPGCAALCMARRGSG